MKFGVIVGAKFLDFIINYDFHSVLSKLVDDKDLECLYLIKPRLLERTKLPLFLLQILVLSKVCLF